MKNIIFAKLVDNIFVPGIGNVDKTLEINKATSKVIKMTKKDNEISVVIRGQQGTQVTFEAPTAAFTHWVLAKE